VNDDAAFQIPGNVAALFSGAIEGEAKARSRVQPLQLAADPIAPLADATTGSKGRVNYYHMAACYHFWGRILDNNIP
jgi:hypothetical protein